MNKKVVIIGIGGHGKVIADIVRKNGDTVECLRIRPTVAEKSGPIICEICGQVIEGAAGLTPEQFAMNTRKKFGKNLCMDCAMAEKEKLESAKGGDK